MPVQSCGHEAHRHAQSLDRADDQHRAERMSMLKAAAPPQLAKPPSPVPADDALERAEQGRVLSRDGNLTMRVGKLPAHWEKKVDPVCWHGCVLFLPSTVHLTILTPSAPPRQPVESTLRTIRVGRLPGLTLDPLLSGNLSVVVIIVELCSLIVSPGCC
jgi:hypothetical protein